WFFLFGNQAQADSDEVAIVLEDGQELMIGEITSIIGNEVVVDLVEEEIVDTSTQTEDGTARPSGMGAPADGQMPEGMEAPADGQMPEGMEAPTGDSTEETTDDTQTSSAKDAAISDNLTSSDTSYSIVSVSSNQQSMPSGEMPSDMQMPSGEMPSGMEMPEDMGTDSTTETTDSADATQSEDTTEEVDTTVTYYNSLGESKSLQIPVGTEVITKLGTVTTFSRLAVGDVIKVVMSSSGSDSYIVKIYIVD
ncbi:MAG: hypothetical protein HGA25_01345, partial [Clostridiales bacterium]|nr:hypothetical protein [Clostridiales bacterium]